jgi:predicted NBD/HSP70 family sugar kinase
LCFGIRTGIGLGIIINGKIYRGDSGMAGNLNRHFFHTDIQYNFCSDEYILEAVQKAGKDLSIGKNSEVDMSSLFCLLEQADIDLIEALESALHPLAELIGKLISIFNPFYVFVCGEVLSHSTELFDRIVKNSGKYCSDKVYQNVKFLRILLDDISIAKSAQDMRVMSSAT